MDRRWVVPAWGGRDNGGVGSEQRTEAGQHRDDSVGRVMGNEQRGPGAAPSLAEPAVVGHGCCVGSGGGGLKLLSKCGRYCAAHGERRCRRGCEILANISYGLAHSLVKR
jgi:hypothetical protein